MKLTKKQKIGIGVAAGLVVAAVAYKKIKGNVKSSIPYAGTFIKGDQSAGITFINLDGSIDGMSNPEEMNAKMIQVYGYAKPWKYTLLSQAQYNAIVQNKSSVLSGLGKYALLQPSDMLY